MGGEARGRIGEGRVEERRRSARDPEGLLTDAMWKMEETINSRVEHIFSFLAL